MNKQATDQHTPLRGHLKSAGLALALGAATWSPQAFSVTETITPDVIFGAGNDNEAWTISTAGNIEVGLRAKERFASVYNKAGNVYTQQAGSTGDGGALWNFEWSVDLDTTAGAASLFSSPWSNYLSVLTISSDTGAGPASIQIPTALAILNYYGDNTTANGAGSYTNILFANAAGQYVEQNSLNIGLLPVSLLGYDPDLTGTYTFELAVYGLNAGANLTGIGEKCDVGHLQSLGTLSEALVSTTIQVNAVPIPAAAWLFGSGLLGLAGIARPRRV